MARLYRWAEYFFYGPVLQRVRTGLLNEVLSSKQALLLGDGDGRFLARLLAHNPEVCALAVDTSATMLHLLRRRCAKQLLSPGLSGPTARLRTQQASALDVAIPVNTDLVVSHFFLDCLTQRELEQLAHQLAAMLPPGARWLVSDFDLPASRWLRPLARFYLRALYAAFGLLTGLRVRQMPAVAAALQRAGFRRFRRREFAAGMLYTELWEVPPSRLPQQSEATACVPASSYGRRVKLSMERSAPPEDVHHDADPRDAQSNPEPPVPSMPQPDPGVFHHAPDTGLAPRQDGATPDTPNEGGNRV